jgi:serine phosphatase RsbU (regulator of sigma subunit)/PAS domain-containing protein/anti-sigma regulatory factor (Ser/Thr protein kinase)
MSQGGRRVAVAAYVLAVGGAAAAISLSLPVVGISDARLWVLVALGLLVAAAEFLQVRFRFGRQVDGSNLVEAAIAPLLVVAPGLTAVLVVAAGQIIAAVVRRNPPVKACFNIAQWSLATAVASALWLAVPDPDITTWAGAAALLCAVAVISVVNLLAFTGAMVLVRGESPATVLRRVAPVFGGGWLPGLAVNALLGLLFALAFAAAPAAVVLFPVPLVVLHLAFRGYAEARADRARLVGMQRAIRVLTDPLDPRQAIADFLREAAACFDTRAASLVLRVEGGRQVHTVDTATDEVTVSLQAEDEATLEAALTAQLGPVRIVASGNGPLSRALALSGRQDCLAAPMLDGGKALGALLLLEQTGVEGRKEGELTVLEALAREAAGAFAKGRLLDSVLEERRKLSTVVSATSDGIASLGDDGSVRSWNPALEHITGLSERVVVGRFDALARLDARTPAGEPVDLSDWAAGAELPEELSVRSQTGGRRRLFCSYSHADDGSGGRALVLVARDVTPVQEFEALRAEFGRLVAQEAARRLVVEQLQAAVVPDKPNVPGVELAVAYVASDPKEPTGGDLWDWHVMPNGELHIAVVDVLGHGVAATKSALSVVHTLRAVALDDTPLEAMVERTATLLERQDPELVATVVLARLDPRTGRLRVASGGHPPALVVSADGRVRQITATGGAIGWPGAGSDGVEEVVLAPGDGLLLYTDGLVEARKDILEGLDSLARETASLAHLPVTEMTDELVARALAGADRRDDTLALVVRRSSVAGAVVPVPLPSGRWQIGPDRHAAQQARRDAVRWLDDRGVPAGDAALVIAELLANAVRAARSIVVLELSVELGRVHIAVSDDGSGLEELPVDTLPPLDAEGSRGLFLVRRLSHGLLLDGSAVGTTVRCWLPTTEAVLLPGQPRRDVVG